jgi:nitrate reductase beta subunit
MGEQPQCFVNCIGKIRLQGFVSKRDEAREDNPVDYLVHVRQLALPLYPQLGLEPNVYYVPPIHVPDPFLVQMFGPGAAKAKETYLSAREDKVLQGLFTLFGSTPFTIHRFKVKDDIAIAYGEKGDELVRVPIEEPLHERKKFDVGRAIARVNTP